MPRSRRPPSAVSDGRLNVMLMADVTGRGGAEKALVDLALRLDRTRFNVSVCATRYAGNYQPLLDAAGVPTFILGRQSRWDIYKLGGLIRLLRAQPVHVLHTHLFGSNTWGRLLGTLARVPVIIAHEHWSSRPRHEMWLDSLLYRLSDRIIVTSEASKRVVIIAERIPRHYISVVYNGVDTEEFAPPPSKEAVRQQMGFPEGAPIIGTLGRLTPDKGGQDDLLRAAASLSGKGHPVRLLIVGDGPLRPDLERLGGELGLGDNVIFTGLKSGQEIPRLLGCMDVFVLPSHREALPIALLEAMSVGLPVVATRVGGIPEVIKDGVNGLLVPPGQSAALESCLERLLTEPGLAAQLGQEGRAHVQARFTLDRTTRRVEQLYEEIARQKQR